MLVKSVEAGVVVEVMVQVLAALPSDPASANAPGNAGKDGLRTGFLPSMGEIQTEFLAPRFGPIQTWLLQPFGEKNSG